jgi:hypothetical protein
MGVDEFETLSIRDFASWGGFRGRLGGQNREETQIADLRLQIDRMSQVGGYMSMGAKKAGAAAGTSP